MYPQISLAQEAVTEESASPTPSAEPTAEPTTEALTESSPSASPEPTIVEEAVTETPEEESGDIPTSESSATLAPSLWKDNSDGSITTINSVGEGVEYKFKDSQVKVVFTKLTTPGSLTIREFTPDESLGLPGKAYEITSDMEDGTFLYDLTLPIPESAGDNPEVKFTESSDTLASAEVVSETKEISDKTITVKGLNHFTIFVIDDGDTDYSDSTGWNVYEVNGCGDNTGCRWVEETNTGKWATWTLPSDATFGSYIVSANWTTWNTQATNAHYQIYNESETLIFTSPDINQQLLANEGSAANGTCSGWYTLGTFDLSAGDYVKIAVEEDTDGHIVADEVKFEKLSAKVNSVSTNKGSYKSGDALNIQVEVTNDGDIVLDPTKEKLTVNIKGPGGYISGTFREAQGLNLNPGESRTYNFYTSPQTIPGIWSEGTYTVSTTIYTPRAANLSYLPGGQNSNTKFVVDNTNPTITFEQPTNDSAHAGVIHLKAVCNEECDYVNFWWREDGELYSSDSKRYHYVNDNGTTFEWDLDSLNAEKWDGSFYPLNDGTYHLYAAGKDIAGNWARTLDIQITIDNTPPSMPTGLARHTADETKEYQCGDIVQRQTLIPFWDDMSGDPSFDHYEYTSFTPDGTIGINRRILYVNYFEHDWVPPSDGTNGFAVRSVDKTGNTSDWALSGETLEGSCQITYDSTKPTVPTAALTAGGKSVLTNGYTDSYTFTFNLASSSDTTRYQLKYWNDIPGSIYKETAPWNPTDLSGYSSSLGVYNDRFTQGEGEHYFSFSACDAADNCSNYSTPFTVTYDKTNPLVEIISPLDGDYIEGTVNLIGNINEINLWRYYYRIKEVASGNTIASKTVYTDSLVNETFYPWDTNGLPDGEYLVQLAARDLADNRGSESEHNITVIVDNNAPETTITSPSEPDYFNGTITITGQTTDANGVDRVVLSAAPYEGSTCGTYSEIGISDNGSDNSPYDWTYDWTPTLEGNYCIKAYGIDMAGNVETSAFVKGIVYDITPPTLTWNNPTDNSTLIGNVPLDVYPDDNLAGVEGSPLIYFAPDGGGSETPISGNTWDTSAPLPLGYYDLIAKVSDRAGNSTEQIIQVGVAAVVSNESSVTPSQTMAVITWTTDRPTSSRVIYDTIPAGIGSAPDYGYTFSTGTSDTSPKTTDHSVTITGLTDGMVYYYRTVSEGSPTAIGGQNSFKTLTYAGAPGPTGGAVAGASTTSALGTSDLYESYGYGGSSDDEEEASDNEEVLGTETAAPSPTPSNENGEVEGAKFLSTSTGKIAVGISLLGLLILFLLFRKRKQDKQN